MATGAIAAVAAMQNRYLRVLERAGATSPSTARTLAELDLKDKRVFRGLVRRGCVVEAGAGRYYLDLERVAARRRRVHVVLMIVLAVVGALLAVAVFSSVSH
jgi:hypothetical protein